MTRTRGFTLIEMTMALAITSIIVAAALSASINIYRSTLAMEQQVAADEDAKVLLDIIMTPILQVGGGNVRPWMAVSNTCVIEGPPLAACPGATDQIHYIELNDAAKEMDILAYAGTGNATIPLVAGACPLTPAAGYPATGTLVVVLPGTPTAGGGWQLKQCTPMGGGACGCVFTDVVGGVSIPPDSGVTPVWSGGTIIAGQTVSIYMSADHALHERRSPSFDDFTPDDRLMADDVYDVQMEFGYDDTPADGAFDGTWVTVLDAARAAGLRMTRVGLVVGSRAPARDRPSTARLFAGTPQTTARGHYLRAVSGAVTMRNLLVFY